MTINPYCMYASLPLCLYTWTGVSASQSQPALDFIMDTEVHLKCFLIGFRHIL